MSLEFLEVRLLPLIHFSYRVIYRSKCFFMPNCEMENELELDRLQGAYKAAVENG